MRIFATCKEIQQKLLELNDQFFQQMSKAFLQRSETNHMAFENTIVGSMAEGTKVFIANEVDTICQFFEDVKITFQLAC